jgi:hypothetical protein
MARSTFDGPILQGDNRFGPFRNVGYTEQYQFATIDNTNTTANTANYGGSSGVFVASNGIPNTAGGVYTPSSTVPPSTATLTAIPADSATNIYRGWVAYIPAGSRIIENYFDIQVAPTLAAGTLTSIQLNISNNYVAAAGTCTYAQTAVLTSPAVGRQSFNTSTAAQLAAMNSTSTDLVGVNGSGAASTNLSQVVFTIAYVGTSMTTISAGTYNFAVAYIQRDGNIGTTTAYPYGNFD